MHQHHLAHTCQHHDLVNRAMSKTIKFTPACDLCKIKFCHTALKKFYNKLHVKNYAIEVVREHQQ